MSRRRPRRIAPRLISGDPAKLRGQSVTRYVKEAINARLCNEGVDAVLFKISPRRPVTRRNERDAMTRETLTWEQLHEAEDKLAAALQELTALRARLDAAEQRWADEFAKRGAETSALEREKAELVARLDAAEQERDALKLRFIEAAMADVPLPKGPKGPKEDHGG